MADAKLGPKMQEWQVEHSNLYLKSDGKEGHVMKRTPPGGYPEMDVYSLMLTTTGRKSGEKFVFPLYYGTTGDSYIIVASKGGAPDHPGWYKNLVANPEVEVQVGTKKLKAKARTVTGEEVDFHGLIARQKISRPAYRCLRRHKDLDEPSCRGGP